MSRTIFGNAIAEATRILEAQRNQAQRNQAQRNQAQRNQQRNAPPPRRTSRRGNAAVEANSQPHTGREGREGRESGREGRESGREGRECVVCLEKLTGRLHDFHANDQHPHSVHIGCLESMKTVNYSRRAPKCPTCRKEVCHVCWQHDPEKGMKISQFESGSKHHVHESCAVDGDGCTICSHMKNLPRNAGSRRAVSRSAAARPGVRGPAPAPAPATERPGSARNRQGTRTGARGARVPVRESPQPQVVVTEQHLDELKQLNASEVSLVNGDATTLCLYLASFFRSPIPTPTDWYWSRIVEVHINGRTIQMQISELSSMLQQKRVWFRLNQPCDQTPFERLLVLMSDPRNSWCRNVPLLPFLTLNDGRSISYVKIQMRAEPVIIPLFEPQGTWNIRTLPNIAMRDSIKAYMAKLNEVNNYISEWTIQPSDVGKMKTKNYVMMPGNILLSCALELKKKTESGTARTDNSRFMLSATDKVLVIQNGSSR
jgi:hypothetical protein